MYEIIPDTLATTGIGDNYLVQPPGEARHEEILMHKDSECKKRGWVILDARIISDEGDSDEYFYRYLIDYGIRILKENRRLVVCCGAGRSRSNAIVLGILIQHFHYGFYEACELIRQRVLIQDIMPEHITKLKQIFNVTIP